MISSHQIEEALKKKEREYTLIPNSAVLRRSVFYFWDSSDTTAAEYCEKIREPEFGRAVGIELTEASAIRDWLKVYAERIRDSQYPIQHNVYCLLISSDEKGFSGKVFADALSDFVSLNYQFLYLGKELPEDAEDNYFEVNWIVSPQDTLVGKILLADASFTYEWINPVNWGFEIRRGWYRLRARRYSSVGDDICGRLYHILTPVFKRDSEEKIFRELNDFYSVMFNEINEVYLTCPSVRHLPIVGYEELASKLFREGRKKSVSSISFKNALQTLFGVEGGELRTEWLRKRIVVQYMQKACDDSINRHKREIYDQLYNRFSLEDLYSRVAAYTLQIAGKFLQDCSETEEKIADLLQKEYAARSSDVSDIWNGCDRYFSLWKQYIEQGLVAAWWNGISKHVVSLSNSRRDDFGELKQAYNDFADYKEHTAGNAVIPVTRINSFSDLLQAIEWSSAVTVYTPEMLGPMRRRAAQLYIRTGDDLSAEERPRIGVLVSKSLIQEADKKVYDEFEWRYYLREYLPNSIIYELRMYQKKVF